MIMQDNCLRKQQSDPIQLPANQPRNPMHLKKKHSKSPVSKKGCPKCSTHYRKTIDFSQIRYFLCFTFFIVVIVVLLQLQNERVIQRMAKGLSRRRRLCCHCMVFGLVRNPCVLLKWFPMQILWHFFLQAERVGTNLNPFGIQSNRRVEGLRKGQYNLIARKTKG